MHFLYDAFGSDELLSKGLSLWLVCSFLFAFPPLFSFFKISVFIVCLCCVLCSFCLLLYVCFVLLPPWWNKVSKCSKTTFEKNLWPMCTTVWHCCEIIWSDLTQLWRLDVIFHPYGWKCRQIWRYFPSAVDGTAYTHVHMNKEQQIWCYAPSLLISRQI